MTYQTSASGSAVDCFQLSSDGNIETSPCSNPVPFFCQRMCAFCLVREVEYATHNSVVGIKVEPDVNIRYKI